MAVISSTGTPAIATVTATGTLTGTWGAGQNRAAGALLVAVVTIGAATASTVIPTPAGWTKQNAGADWTAANERTAVFTATAAGADAAWSGTVTFTTGSASVTQFELANGAAVQTSASSTATGPLSVTSAAAVALAGNYCIAAFTEFFTTSANTGTFNAGGTGYAAVVDNGATSSQAHTAVTAAANVATGSTTTATNGWSNSLTNTLNVVVVISPAVVAFDAVGPSAAGAGNVSGASLSWTHTCGAGATALYAGVVVGQAGPGDNTFTVTATYNGIAMTALSPGQSANATALTGTNGFVKVFRLASPPTGSAFNVVVSCSPTAGALCGGSISVTGSSTESAVVQGFSATSVSSASINIPSTTAGNLCLAFTGNGSIGADTWTAGTERYENDQSSAYGAGNTAAATLASPGGTATMSWTQPSDDYCVIAFEVQAGAAPSAASPAWPPQARRSTRKRRRARQSAQALAPAAVAASYFNPVGSIVSTTTASLAVSPSAVGAFYLVGVQTASATIWCTSISGGNCTWVQLGARQAGSSQSYTLFAGTATATGAATATLTFNGAQPTTRCAGQLFTATGPWAVDVLGQVDNAGGSTLPSLSPAESGDLYFSFVWWNGTLTAGSTPGYTYQADANGNPLVYNQNCDTGTQAPAEASTSSGTFGMGVLLRSVTAPYVVAAVSSSGVNPQVTVTTPTAAGDGVFVSANTAAACTAVSDTQGNTYLQVFMDSTNGVSFYAATYKGSPGTPTAALSTSDKVNCTCSATGNWAVLASGCSGVAAQARTAANPSGAATAVTASGTAASVPLTPGNAGDLVILAQGFGATPGTITYTGGFAKVADVGLATNGESQGYLYAPSASAMNCTATLGNSVGWWDGAASFALLPAAGTVTGAASLSGTGTFTAAVTQGPGVAVSGTGTMTAGPPGVTVPGAASLSGTGTLSTAATQQATAALSGTGTLTTTVVQQPGVAASGTGVLTAPEVLQPTVALSGTGTMTNAERQGATVALSGTGTMTSAGVQLPSVPLSGTGAISFGEIDQQPAASLSGTGTMTAGPPSVTVPGAASLSGTGTMTAGPPFVGVPAGASLSGTGTLTTSVTQQPGVSLSGTGTLTAPEVLQPTVSLSGTGTMATAVRQQPTVALSGTGTLTATGTVGIFASAGLSGSGVLSAAATQGPGAALAGSGALTTALTWPAGASLSGTGTLSTPVVQGPGAALSGSGIMSTAVAWAAGAGLSGTGSLSAAVAQQPGAALSGTGSLSTAVGGVQPASASLSGTGTLSAAVTTQPGAALSGTGVLSSFVSIGQVVSASGTGTLSTSASTQPAASLSGTGSLVSAVVQGPAVVLAGTGALSGFVSTGPQVSASGTGSLTTAVGGVQPGAASLSGTGSFTTSVVQGPGVAASGNGSLTTSAGSQQQGAATLSGTGTLTSGAGQLPTVGLSGTGTVTVAETTGTGVSLAGSGALGTAVVTGPGASLAGSGALTAAVTVTGGAGAALSGTGTLSAATTIVIAPTVALSGTGVASVSTTGRVVSDSDSVAILDSEFTWVNDSDSLSMADTAETVRVRDTDSVKQTEAELSAWPKDTERVTVTEAAWWSGPIADLVPDHLGITDGGERIKVADVWPGGESAVSDDEHLVEVWTTQPPFRWTGSEFRLVWDGRLAWKGPRVDKAALELHRRLMQAERVEYVHDTDSVSLAEDQAQEFLNVQVSVASSIEVTVSVDV